MSISDVAMTLPSMTSARMPAQHFVVVGGSNGRVVVSD